MPVEDKSERWSEPVALKSLDVAAITVSTTVMSLAAYFGFRHGMRDLGRHLEIGMRDHGKHLEAGMRNMMSGRGSGAEHLESGLDKLGKWLSGKA